jgi:ElaB/YqjD/DUF883 family membrane-anchored ribosome-binding protein
MRRFAEGAQDVAGGVRDYSSSVGGRVADTAGRTRRQATEMVRQGRESATSFITDQPLLCAAIGVAVGAAIASLLPQTETEDEWMGEASDTLKGAAGQVASDSLDSARNVAGKVVERAQSAAKEEGLAPGAARKAAQSLGEGLREAMGETGERGSASRPMTGAGPQEFPGSNA